MNLRRSDFPEDFEFGAATSAYQIEGSSFGGGGSSHWDSFSGTSSHILDGSTGAVTCDHYHRYEEDFDLLRDAGFDAYRFSISWARIFPEGRGTPNEAGLDYYDRLVDELLERGIRPHVTLYHWDLPSALADLGGWCNRETAVQFGEYAHVAAGLLGDRISTFATLNEPWCAGWLSHFQGLHAPGLSDMRAAARAMHHLLLAHGLGTQALRADGFRNLGIVLNLQPVHAALPGRDHIKAARLEDSIANAWFLEALFNGRYPEELLEALLPHMPVGWQEDLALISRPLDWIGVNYYSRRLVSHDPNVPWPHLRIHPPRLPTTSLDWEVYPEGLHEVLSRLQYDYSRGIPIYIMENGTSDTEHSHSGQIFDMNRIEYLDAHFAQARRAISNGVALRGYFIWSLLDNLEWTYGYTQRFGLVHVDFDTLKRTPKESYRQLAASLTRGPHRSRKTETTLSDVG